MNRIPLPKTPDFSAFSANAAHPQALYGLPEKILFCKKCVISNQRPNSCVEFKNNNQAKVVIHFDEEGVCDACRFAEHKKQIDWQERERQLIALCDRFRGDGSNYDCLVPGSGGKDSFYAAHMLKYKYGMHPLTVTWAPHMYTDWGRGNHERWLNAGFDNYLMTPNGRTHRLLTRLAVENLFHPFQPFMLGQKNLAPQMAQRFNIPLVFYGENEAEYGNPIADTEVAKRNAAYFTETDYNQFYLGGETVKSLTEDFGVPLVDLKPYFPVAPSEDMEVHYLGYYLKWHPQSCYYYAVEHGGFQPSPERTPGTYSKYNSIDDKIDDFHYYTTGIKFGIGRASYEAAQEIRSGDITREEGVALVKRFDLEFPERFAEETYQYLSIPEKEFPVASRRFERPIMDHGYFMQLCDAFRSPHVWQYAGGDWQLRHTVWNELQEAA